MTDIVPPFEVQKYCLESWFVKLCNKNKIYDLKEYSFQYEINNKSVSEFPLSFTLILDHGTKMKI